MRLTPSVRSLALAEPPLRSAGALSRVWGRKGQKELPEEVCLEWGPWGLRLHV